MFKELIGFWRDESGLKHIIKHFDEMLIIAKDMFNLSVTCMLENKCLDTSKKDIIRMDGQLNTLQQVIRRDIITHLSVSGNADMVPCLVLMTIIKDAERIGDYVKNLFEIAERCPEMQSDPLIPELIDMTKRMDTWFGQTKDAFDNIDKDLARQVREETFDYEKKCDKIVWDLAICKNDRNAVAIALEFRFIKRIIAHLANICTSVVMPLDKIDYYQPLNS